MSYKPNYCCQCGDKIERIEWNFNSSRRFCELCETDFKFYDLLPRIAVIGGVLLCVLGFGTYWQKSGKSSADAPKQLLGAAFNPNKNTKQNVAPQVSTNQNTASSEQARETAPTAETKLQNPSSANNLKPNKPEAAADIPPVKIYYCGAQTKKGSPCTRRVKGGGRCWQHTGQAAMLPPEKLLISQ